MTALDIMNDQMAVAWTWRDGHGKRRSTVELVDLRSSMTRTVLRAGRSGQLISPVLTTTGLYFARAATTASRFYRYTDGRLSWQSAPDHLTSIALGITQGPPPSR